MKLKLIVGIIISSLLSLISCERFEYEPLVTTNPYIEYKSAPKYPDVNIIKDFSRVDTKATLVPVWTEGDAICVYSMSNDNKILYIDTCTVYNINRNLANIKAEVSKEASYYCAVYPYDHFQGRIGEALDLSQKGIIHHSGNLGDESPMIAFCPSTGNTLDFQSRYSLFRCTGLNSNNFPLTIKFYFKDGSTVLHTYMSNVDGHLYSAISHNEVSCPKFEITYRKLVGFRYQNTTITKYPKESFIPGTIYSYTLK